MSEPYIPMSPIPDWIPVKQTDISDYPTAQAEDIIERLVPEWAALFLRKNNGYGRVDNHLGPAGVFPDVNRKVGRLERDVWNAEPVLPGSEPTREVILDLVGHLFLMLHILDEQKITDSELSNRLAESYNGEGFLSSDPVTAPSNYERVTEALRRCLHGKPLTPEQMDAIREFLGDGGESPLDGPVDYAETATERFLKEGREPVGRGVAGPLSDWILGADGKLRPLTNRASALMSASKDDGQAYNDGWEYLPDEVQKAIVMLANGHEVVSTPNLRLEAAQYLSEHGHDGG